MLGMSISFCLYTPVIQPTGMRFLVEDGLLSKNCTLVHVKSIPSFLDILTTYPFKKKILGMIYTLFGLTTQFIKVTQTFFIVLILF